MSVGSFLAKVVPWIGAAASGNIPALASLAAEAVSKVTGKPVAANAEAISAAVAGATPDQLLALKQADNDFAEKMRAMGFEYAEDILKIEADDRANARAREVSLKDRYVPVLATFVVASATVAIVAVLRGWSKVESAFAGTLVGFLSSNATQVVSYYFGSSAAHDSLVASQSSGK